MRELSLNILDIAQNSVAAGSPVTTITVEESTVEKTLVITISDTGKGMTEEQLKNVTDPFFTTRTTRRVGMGIPLFKMAAEQTGGSFEITSTLGRGTKTMAVFKTDSVDFTPLGDVAGTAATLVSMNESLDFVFKFVKDKNEFVFSSAEVKKLLDGVPLSTPSVVNWITEYIKENTEALNIA